MPSSKPKDRFHDIVEHIDAINDYARGLSKSALKSDKKTIHAIERCLAIISEAAVKLGNDAKAIAPDIPWGEIRGLGNIIRHGYDQVNIETIWDIIEVDLPPLRAACTEAIEKLKN